MALNLHATISPASVPTLNDILTITIDKPQRATDVMLQLDEDDQWIVSNGISNSNADRIARFRGEIVGGKFKGKLDSKNKPTAKSRILKVKIDGDPTIHDLPLLADSKNEVEGGVLEITLFVSAKVDGKEVKFLSPTPVFVRNVTKKRAILTFLVGAAGGGFFHFANQYWKHFGDVVEENHRTLDSILSFLSNSNNRPSTEPWGEVNIVSHGEDTGPRGKGSKVEFSKIFFPWKSGIDPHFDPITAELLKKEKSNPLLETPDVANLDINSRIVIRGCEIGPDQELLDTLRVRFGGQAVVLAPKMVQEYRGTTPPSEHLFEYFFVFLKGDRISEFGKKISSATLTEVTHLLRGKYGKIMSDAQWEKLIRQSPPLRRIAVEVTGDFSTDFTPAPAKGHDFDADARDNFNTKVKDEGPQSVNFTDFDDWKWRHSKTAIKGGISDHAIGVRTRIDVRRQKTIFNPDTNTDEPVTPNPSDPTQYGRSPSNMT